MSDLFYTETGSVNPYYNLAFEEYILTTKTEGSYIILWQNDNTVVIGRNQNTVEEINSAFVDEHDINVVRRNTGGGAVYHDLGNLNYSFICDAGDVETMTLERFTTPIVKALKSLGLCAEASGRNDILVNGLKVSGTAQRLYNNRVLHHGTLLFASNPNMIAGALNADPSKFISKSAKSVRSRVGNISDFLDNGMSIAEFWTYIKGYLTDGNADVISLSDEELDCIKALEQNKYATWEWNYGHCPKYNMQNKKRWQGGTLEVQTSVEKGIINDIVFFGDFLALKDVSELTDAIKGTRNVKSELESVLLRFELRDYFGSITLDEVLDTMFG